MTKLDEKKFTDDFTKLIEKVEANSPLSENINAWEKVTRVVITQMQVIQTEIVRWRAEAAAAPPLSSKKVLEEKGRIPVSDNED